MQKICVLGLGYIGLPTSSLLATKGFNVVGVDTKVEVVAKLNKGEIHIVESGLDILVKAAVNSGNFKASLKPEAADIFILAVPTPIKTDKSADLSYVEAASKTIAEYLKPGNLVILESTSPVGTTAFVREVIEKAKPGLKNIGYVHCPERVIPGKVLQELVENDRVVGGLDAAATEKAAEFYRTFVSGKVLTTNAQTAEMCKLAENAFRDVNIAFANEMSLICDELDINPWELIKLANHHPRVNILQPGPGVGGHCIAVDPWFIAASAPNTAKLIPTARRVNDSKPNWVIAKVELAAAKFKSPVIACLGAAFKADVDDLRESPSLEIIQKLQDDNIGEVLVCEPNISELPHANLVNLHDALERADIVVILVDHKEFKAIDPVCLQSKILLDTRGVFKEYSLAMRKLESLAQTAMAGAE